MEVQTSNLIIPEYIGCHQELYIYIYTVSHRSDYTPYIFVNILLYIFM